MQIGIDVSPLTPQRTGVGNYTYYMLRHLLAQGEEHIFKAFSSGIHGVDLAGLPPFAKHRHIGVPTRALYKCWSLFGRPRVDRLLKGVDIYHATNYFLPPTKKARRVVSVYDLAFLRVPELCSPKIVGPFSAGVKRFVREADAVITCSEATRRDVVELLDINEAQVHVAYGAVDENFASIPRPQAVDLLAQQYDVQQPFILFVSTLEPRKNVTGLLQAFAHIARDIPHTLVLIGGMGWYDENLDEHIEKLGISERVRRLGYVTPRSHLPAFYSAADAFVFPSFYEGFGLPALEAMTCGCPVITANTSSLPEVVGDAAQLVQPEDIDGLAATMRMVLTNERLREQMSTQGLQQAQRFSWTACAERTLDVYRSLA